MKRLLALLVVLAVLGICAPSYGYILIYKAQIYGKALNFDDGSMDYGKVKAFLVLAIGTVELDTFTALNMVPSGDEILASDLIFYDRYKGPKYYAEVRPYIELAQTPQPDATVEALTINMGEGNVQAIVVGKLKPTNIGLGKKVNVPQDLAGSMLWNGSFLDLADIIGAATVTATLETKLTKMANTVNVESEEEAFGLTIDAIIKSLQDKGFPDLFD
jgi:hypothetical protein